jgi:hypothetical protein
MSAGYGGVSKVSRITGVSRATITKGAKYLKAVAPVISADTKKKENIGNFKNNGWEYRHTKDPRKVLDHDFPLEELGKISPYGVYNLNNNTGSVNVVASHDTSEFAVESISRWWETVGKHTFSNRGRIYITCDSGGSNGCRARMWKYQLQEFASRVGLEIEVSHFPRGAPTTTELEVICVRDDIEYKLARKVADEEFETISIVKIPPFEVWNYKITPA